MSKYFEGALLAEGMTGQMADLARSIFMQESGGGKNTTTSNAGAVGGMQIIPSTFASVADKGWDINNPLHNARAGIRYIQQMNKLAGGDPTLTAAGYYGGPGAIAKAKQGIAVSDPRNPKAPNTLQYGAQVVARMPKRATTQEEAVATAPATSAATMPPDAPVVSAEPLSTPGFDAASQAAKEWTAFKQAMPVAQASPVAAQEAPVESMASYGNVDFEATPMKAPDFNTIMSSLSRFMPQQRPSFRGFSGFGAKA